MEIFNNIISVTKTFVDTVTHTVAAPFHAASPSSTSGTVQVSGGSYQVGQHVMTVYGRGYIHAVRKEDYVVKLFGWKLAQGQSPTCHLAPEAIKPLFVVGQEVKTIYGRGYIESVRLDKGDYVVKLFGWKLAQKQSPTLYLAHDSIQALFSVYEPVSTVYGKGFVQSVRAKDFVVKLDGWKLADGKSPTLYLAGDSMQVAKGC